MIIATGLGIPLGVWTALHRGSRMAQILLAASLIGVALPTFLIGIVLILVFSVWLGWLPSFGRGEVVSIGGWTTGLLTWSGIKALILPSVTLGLFQLTLIMRLTRAEMLEVMRSDFIRFARARGLRRRTIEYGHALRNTLVPVITIVGLQFGNVFAFSIIVETVFQWPGLGLLVIQAIQFADVPAARGLSRPDRAVLRGHQSCRRRALCRDRPAGRRGRTGAADRIMSATDTATVKARPRLVGRRPGLFLPAFARRDHSRARHDHPACGRARRRHRRARSMPSIRRAPT